MPKMDEILNNLTSLSWWFGVVVVGVAVNILTGGVQVGTASLTSKYAKFARLRSFKAKRSHLTAVQGVRHDERIFHLYVSHKAYMVGSSIWWMVAGAMFIGMVCVMYIPAEGASSRWSELPKWLVSGVRRAALLAAMLCVLLSVLRMRRALLIHSILGDSVFRHRKKARRAREAVSQRAP